MATSRGRYYLRGKSIQKRQAGVILGNAYGMPQTTATSQFEGLARNYFRMYPMATYYMDSNTGVVYSRV